MVPFGQLAAAAPSPSLFDGHNPSSTPLKFASLSLNIPGVWSTPSHNEDKLNQAFRDHQYVILIFSVNSSKAFQGFAFISCEARHDSQPIDLILPPGKSNRNFSDDIYIRWETCQSLPFCKTLHLLNSWNENKPISIRRDGQEIEPRCAEALCRLFPSDPTIDIISVTTEVKNNKKHNSSRSQSHLPFPINVSSSSPLETSPASLLIIKGQTLKDRNHRSLPNHRHRPMSSDFSSRHSSNRYRHRSPSNHNRHRHQKSRSRERENQDLRQKRRRSRSSHSDHGRKNSSNRKHLHCSNDDEVSYNNTYKTITEITSETYEKYMTHLILTHTQYAGYGTAMFPSG
ncbi:unnamed protein product, partial [Rotaria sp. Silwood1]